MEDKSLLVDSTWWKNKKTGEMGFITDIQEKEGLIIFRFAKSGHVGSFTNMEFLREFEILPSDLKSVPESNVNNECDKLQTHAIIPGSIYFNCIGGIHIVIPFKEESGVISFIMSDCLNDEVYFTTDVSEFIERYTLYQVFNKPDNGKAFDELVNKTKELYDKIINKMNKEEKEEIVMERPLTYEKNTIKCIVDGVINDTLDMFDGLWVYKSWKDMFVWSGRYSPLNCAKMNIHTRFKDNEYVVYDPDDKSIFITISIPHGIVNSSKGALKDDVFNKISENLVKVFKDIFKTSPEYSTADEKIKPNKTETYLKTDESKLEDFGTGAKREDKTGKGRYDLIPGDVMNQLEDFAWATYFMNGSTTCSATDVSKSAYFDDWTNVELYYDFIVNVISYFFAKDHVECTDDCGEISYEVNWDVFRSGLYEMRKQLALHYEAGAAVHGVDNWKKGLPVYGSERGGCFLDSMRRHIDQALQGKDDEPHPIAAIWNAFGAVWTLNNNNQDKENETEHNYSYEYFTLPSGRRLKVMCLDPDDESYTSFREALIHDIGLVNDLTKSLRKFNHPEDNQN